jgi:anaerobic ribonucleoside-triphosphate reductase activating protein
MRIFGVLPASWVNGDGCRFVVFVQGCGHHCKGCQNPDSWDFGAGNEWAPEELADYFNEKGRYKDGITLSGGDPFYQQEECLRLLDCLPGVNVWIYTGFEYDEIKDTELAKRADVLVTGPYIEELRCEGKMYGSSNQEIHRKE